MATLKMGEMLVARGYVTEEQLQAALDAQNGLPTLLALGDTLVSMGYLSPRDKCRVLAEQWGVEFVELRDAPVDESAARSVNQEICRRYRALPIAQRNGKTVLAMKEPNDIYAIDALRLLVGGEVEPVMAMEEDILEALNRVYHHDASAGLEGIDFDAIQVPAGSEEEDELDTGDLINMAQEAPVVKLANRIIHQAVQAGASDIHIEPQRGGIRTRYRVDGILHEGMQLPHKVMAPLISRVKIMASMDIAEKRAPQDGRISLLIDTKQYDFRVSTLPSAFGEKVVLRVLDKTNLNRGLHQLGFLPRIMEQLENMLQRTYGIILVTGPTGSGKSTSLYSMLSKLNSTEKNIITIEDPVEYELAGITQSGVNPKAGLTFATGLRTMLRQDPDIIMVGEIRDGETALIAIEAALTGHLVLSTLHTNDAPGAVARLTDMGVEPFLISSAVVGVLAQRLARQICPRCKVSYHPPLDALRRLGMTIDTDEPVTFYRGTGCDACRGTGYKGRIGIYELMSMNDEVRELAMERAGSHRIKEAAVRNGMSTLKQDAIEKVLLGVTTLEETFRVVYGG